MKVKRLFHFSKSRKYPIKRDEEGHSLRHRAFGLFNKGLRPSQIYKRKLLKASKSTLYRYYEDWKHDYDHLSLKMVNEIKKKNPEFKDQLIQALSKELKIPVEEVVKKLDRPWGLKQILLGERPSRILAEIRSDAESRLMGRLHMIRLAEMLRKSPQDLAELIMQITFIDAGDIIKIIKKNKTKVWKIVRLEDGISLRMEYSEE